MATSLAVQINESVSKSEQQLGDGLELLERARATANDPSGERDRLLAAIVGNYRCGPREPWATALLDVVAPALLERLKRYRAEPPAIDLEDVRQQFLVELLRAAATMPLPVDAHFMERRLILRAGQGVRRWLAKERRWRAIRVPLAVEEDQL